MIPYEKLIMGQLDGDTPKEKFDKLVLIQKTLNEIAYPRRGTEEETMTIQDVANKIIKAGLVIQHRDY